MEAVSGARRRCHQTAYLRHRVGAHRNHCAAPAAGRRPGPPRPAHVAGRVPAAAPPARDLGVKPVVSPARCTVHPASCRESGIHRLAFHGGLRVGGVLAAVAAVAAFGVVRGAGACTQLCRLVVTPGLDAVVLPAPPQPAADWAQRCRKAVGTKESESSICPGCADGDLSRCPGGADSPAGGDDHGVDVLAGAAHHRRVVDEVCGRPDRCGRDGHLVAWAGAVQCRTGQI
ncbi:Uncharacterised protein [Mycobacterium tuberculosis]|nr:Uncharacterised protein [Mycobacterium tuberculosis]CNU62403.1 Uncharacterised protein [Mycobacterium tuberculosis]